MPLVWKHLLGPGVFWARRDDGTPVPVEFSLDDVKHFHRAGKAMLSAGEHVPIPLEHQKGAGPVSRADRLAKAVLNNTGWVGGYRMDRRNHLWVGLDVKDPEVAKKLDTTIKYVSPYIAPEYVSG